MSDPDIDVLVMPPPPKHHIQTQPYPLIFAPNNSKPTTHQHNSKDTTTNISSQSHSQPLSPSHSPPHSPSSVSPLSSPSPSSPAPSSPTLSATSPVLSPSLSPRILIKHAHQRAHHQPLVIAGSRSSTKSVSTTASFSSSSASTSSLSHSHSHTHSDHHHHHHHHHHHSHHHDHHVVGTHGLTRRSFWNTKCSCIFSALPDELLLFNVFSFLDTNNLCTLQSVCTRWKFLSSDRVLWQRLDLSNVAKTLTDEVLTRLIQRVGNFLDVLKLCNCSHISTLVLEGLGIQTGGLRELHLCNIRNLQDQAVMVLAENCSEMRHISLYGCLQLTDRAMQTIGTHCKELEELSVRGCTKLTSSALITLPYTLKGLNIAGCKLISSGSPDFHQFTETCSNLQRLNAHGIQLEDGGIDLIATRCIGLNTLHISSANPFGGNANVTDSAIYSLSRLPSLSCLNIQGSSNITDGAIDVMMRSLPHLERLNVGGCYRLTDAAIGSISRYAKSMTHLSIFQCFHVTDAGIVQLIQKLNTVQHLDLHSCVSLTGQVLQMLIQVRAQEDEKGRETGASSTVVLAQDKKTKIVEDLDGNISLVETKILAPLSPFHSPNLVSLDIGSCKHIKLEDVNALKAARPAVNVVFY